MLIYQEVDLCIEGYLFPGHTRTPEDIQPFASSRPEFHVTPAPGSRHQDRPRELLPCILPIVFCSPINITGGDDLMLTEEVPIL